MAKKIKSVTKVLIVRKREEKKAKFVKKKKKPFILLFYSFLAKHVPVDVNLKNRLIENHFWERQFSTKFLDESRFYKDNFHIFFKKRDESCLL